MTQALCTHLGVLEGAHSTVSRREGGKSRSITIDIYEKNILAKCYSLASISRKGGGEEAMKFMVLLNGAEQPRDLILKYPKSTGSEIRLYMNQSFGFYGNFGDEFIIYLKSGSKLPHVGFIARIRFSEISNALLLKNPEIDDTNCYCGDELTNEIKNFIGSL